jgi:hypothetical protein
MKSTRKTYDTRYKLKNKLAWSTCKQQHQYIQIPFCSFSLICVDNFHRTSVSLSLHLLWQAFAPDKGNICSSSKSEYLFLPCFSFFAYSRICQTLSRRTRSVALYRKWSSWRRKSGVVYLFKSMRVCTHTSLVIVAALVIKKKKKNKRERARQRGKKIYIHAYIRTR